MIAMLMFAALFVLLLFGFPVAFTLGGVALIFSFFTDFGLQGLTLLPGRILGITNNYILLAVPLFIYMGVMLEKSGIAEELLETMALLFGRLRGGMAISVVLVGALLAASTGIVGATVVTMGLLSLPTMLKHGYDAKLACGTVAAAGTLGQIIPPSIILILLASVLGVDPGTMFMAALLPGILLVLLYLVWIGIVTMVRPAAAPSMPAEMREQFQGRQLAAQVSRAFLPPFILIVAVLGSIFAGIAPPTEAAGVGALGATLLTLLHGRLSLNTLRAVMRQTTHLTSMVFIILVGAGAFSLVFSDLDGDRYLASLIVGIDLGPTGFLLTVMLIIFIAGFFIDFIEITFILVPVILPLFRLAFGTEVVGNEMLIVWLGILIAMNLQTSFLTPPFGFSLFYLKGVTPPGVKTGDLYRGILPYIVIQLLVVITMMLWPDLVLWLPRAMAAGR